MDSSATPVPSSAESSLGALKGQGEPFSSSLRAFFEPRFAADFGSVRIHTSPESDRLNQQLNARAFTMGHDIFFRRGQYDPNGSHGRDLIAHELTHVLQQKGRSGSSQAVQTSGGTTRTLGEGSTKTPAVSSASSEAGMLLQLQEMACFAIHDPAIADPECTLLARLEDLREHLMNNVRIPPYDPDWTLVLAVHGSEDHLSESSHGETPVTFDERGLRGIFETDVFQQWRQTNGPALIVLTACQVTAAFEGVIISLLTRTGTSGQLPQGLGQGCRPAVDFEHPPNVTALTRADFDQLPAADQRTFLSGLSQLNSRWGYYGRPPITARSAELSPEGLGEEELGGGEEFGPPTEQPHVSRTPIEERLLHFYYDEVPGGSWPIVRVMVPVDRVPEIEREEGEHPHHERHNSWVTNIAFYNRARNARFQRYCPEAPGQQARPEPASRMTTTSP